MLRQGVTTLHNTAKSEGFLNSRNNAIRIYCSFSSALPLRIADRDRIIEKQNFRRTIAVYPPTRVRGFTVAFNDRTTDIEPRP